MVMPFVPKNAFVKLYFCPRPRGARRQRQGEQHHHRALSGGFPASYPGFARGQPCALCAPPFVWYALILPGL